VIADEFLSGRSGRRRRRSTIRTTVVVDGKYTRRCFAGWSYGFDLSGATLASTRQVTAAWATTGQFTVVVV
jgi:hypothetical protein